MVFGPAQIRQCSSRRFRAWIGALSGLDMRIATYQGDDSFPAILWKIAAVVWRNWDLLTMHPSFQKADNSHVYRLPASLNLQLLRL